MLESIMFYILVFLVALGCMTRHWFPTGLILIAGIAYILAGHFLFFGDPCM